MTCQALENGGFQRIQNIPFFRIEMREIIVIKNFHLKSRLVFLQPHLPHIIKILFPALKHQGENSRRA